MFPLWLRQLPRCGDRTPASVLLPTEGRSSPTNILVFSPCFFALPSFSWLYIFFSSGKVLLSALSCCSACTSMSEGIFLMYSWREMYSTSTYSSAILFYSVFFFKVQKTHCLKITQMITIPSAHNFFSDVNCFVKLNISMKGKDNKIVTKGQLKCSAYEIHPIQGFGSNLKGWEIQEILRGWG